MTELRVLVVDGLNEIKNMLKEMDARIDGRVGRAEERLRALETEQATSKGQHKTQSGVINWVVTGLQTLAIGSILAIAEHLAK